MTTIKKLIDYCKNTPHNTNPAVIESMVKDLMENGETRVSINGVGYKNLVDAINAAESGAEIILSEDIKEIESIRLTKTLTLKLNGNTIKAENGIPFILKDGGKLTIIAKEGAPAVKGTIALAGNNTNLIIEGGVYEAALEGYAALQTNGSFPNSNVTVKNASFISNDNTVYLPAQGKYVFENCSITGATGIYVKSGELELINCIVKATGAAANPIPNGNGADSTGDGIILDSKQGYNGNMSLTIKGNTVVNSENGYAIHEAITDLGVSATVALNIEDGKFSGKEALKVSDAFTQAVEAKQINCAIAGGEYSSEINKKYLAEGKECVFNNGKYFVK